jgi:hypothetical protein
MTTTARRDYGRRRNLAKEALQSKALDRKSREKVPNAEPAVVVAYHFHTQRVDVKFKNRPGRPHLLNVPIEDTGGDFGVIRPFEPGDSGLLIPTWSDATSSWNDPEIRVPRTMRKNDGKTWLFRPGPIRRDQPLPTIAHPAASPSDLNRCGPRDAALFSRNGDSGIIFKEGGEVVIIGTNLYILGLNDSPGSAARIAREGDSVSTPMGSGSISSGSNRARST